MKTVIGSKHKEIVSKRIQDIINNEELPVELSDILEGKENPPYLAVRCCCGNCGFSKLAADDKAYDLFPGKPDEFAVIRTECADTMIHRIVFKTSALSLFYESICDN